MLDPGYVAAVINMFRFPDLLTNAIFEAIEIEIGIAIGIEGT